MPSYGYHRGRTINLIYCWCKDSIFRGLLLYNTIAPWYNAPSSVDLWFLMFSKTCVYINRYVEHMTFNHINLIKYFNSLSAINPILYNVLSTKFRKSFQKMFCRKKSNIGKYKMIYANYSIQIFRQCSHQCRLGSTTAGNLNYLELTFLQSH